MALRRGRTHADPPDALTAAAAFVRLEGTGSWKTWRFGETDWQAEAWRLYDIVGELRFLGNWMGDAISQCELFVADVDSSGQPGKKTGDEEIARLASVPLGAGNTADENLRLLGINLVVPGEAWIVGEAGGNDDDSDRWFIVSGSEIRKGGGLWITRPDSQGGGKLRFREGTDLLMRVWTPHPRRLNQADSPTRAAIPVLREIELLTKREFAELDSRLTGAGFWFLPEGIDFPRAKDDPEGIAGFMAYMQRVIGTAMADQSSASAMSPAIATIPDQLLEHLDKFKEPGRFWSDLSDQIMPMKKAAIERLALAFDIPPEILTGFGDTNHWTSWLVSEEGIKKLNPILSRIADALTRGYLRPALTDMGEDPDAFAYAFDLAPLTVRPNRMSDALQLWDRLVLSDAELQRSGAFDKDTRPDDAEVLRRLIVKAVTEQPGLIADPVVQQLLGVQLSVGQGVAGEIDDRGNRPQPQDETPPEQRRALPSGGEEGPSDDGGQGPRVPDSEAGLVAVAKLAVLRALELAGGKLVSHAERRRCCDGMPRFELHTQAGPIDRDKADQVLAGAWEHVPIVASELGMDADRLSAILNGYCLELLTRGLPHDDNLLRAALLTATAGVGAGRD